MLEVAYDRNAAVLVARISGAVSESDLMQLGEALIKLDTASLEYNRIPITILIVRASVASPNAEQRRLMSDLWQPMKSPLHVFALVSTSPVARGVMKVVQWLDPPGTKRREAVHGSFEEAARWAEKERGEPIPVLRVLPQQLERTATAATAKR